MPASTHPPAPADRWAGPIAGLKSDLPAGLVVFLVAVPLCLGIAQASGAPLLGGLIAGVVGGLVVALISGSPLSVSGPAAGLAVIVAGSIQTLGLRAFFLSVMLAGALQIALGVLRLGVIAHYFPNAVIKGMLAAIGLLIVLKQIPHAVGYDKDWMGDPAFVQRDGHNTFTAIRDALGALSPAAILVTATCAAAMALWPRLQRGTLKLVPPALVAVVAGAIVAAMLPRLGADGALSGEHMVALPVLSSFGDVTAALVTPDVGRIGDPAVWRAAVALGIVASVETLLSIEAVDRLDPLRRISPTNRELVAQGVGNVLCGMIGGLPITSVIVRSSANVQAGAKTRMSAMVHGVLLLFGVLFLATALNRVPLAALSVVLIVVGAKLSTPSLWKSMWRAGYSQFIPFAVTIAAVIFTDLLLGTALGLGVGLVFALHRQQQNSVVITKDGDRVSIRFTKDMTFLQKAHIKEVLRGIPEGATVVIDRRVVDFVDDDVEEILAEFAENAASHGITVAEDRGGAEREPRPPSAADH